MCCLSSVSFNLRRDPCERSYRTSSFSIDQVIKKMQQAGLRSIKVTYGQGWLDTPREMSLSNAKVFADDSDLLKMNLSGAITDEPISVEGIVNPYVKMGGKLASPAFEIDKKCGLVSGTFAFLTGGLSILTQGDLGSTPGERRLL